MKHSLLKKLACSLLAFALAFALAGCTQENPPEKPAAGVTHFYVQLDGGGVLVDANGNEIMRDENLEPLYGFYEYDPAYSPFVTLTRYEYLDENGQDIEYLATHMALYGADGALLQDFSRCNYSAAFGDFVIRNNIDYNTIPFVPEDVGPVSDIINAYTGEVVFPGGAYAYIENGIAVIHDVNWKLIAVTDLEGNMVENYPIENPYYAIRKFGDFYIAQLSTETTESVLLNALFQPISDVYTDGMGQAAYYSNTPYFFGYNEEGADVIDSSTGEIVFHIDGQDVAPRYYDGDVYYCIEDYYSQDPICRLYNVESGTELATNPDGFYLHCAEGATPARYYIADENGNLCRIDKDGTVLGQSNLPFSSTFVSISETRSVVRINNSTEVDGAVVDATYYVVDENLQIMAELQGSRYVTHPYIPTGSENIFLLSRHVDETSTWVYDAFDFNGNLLQEGLPYYLIQYSAGGYLVLTTADGYAGVMDLEGNWLYQTEFVYSGTE